MTIYDTDSLALMRQKLLTARIIHQRETKMSRTAEVKRRLGPIMERMKASLDNIHRLEESLGKNSCQVLTQEENEVSKKDDSKAVTTVPVRQDSRKLLKASMDMLKRKLSSLQRLEETLHASEDRRQNLQHYFLQAALSKPMLELASTRRRNKDLERKLAALESDSQGLELKCRAVDKLQLKIISLTQELHHYNEMQATVDRLTAENKAYVSDLEERQAKLNEQAVRRDDLECQIDQLNTLCDELTKELKNEQKRSNMLERELLRSKQVKATGGQKAMAWSIKSQGSGDSTSTSTTEIDNDSSTATSSMTNESTSSQDDECHIGNCSHQVVEEESGNDRQISLIEQEQFNISEDVDISRGSLFDDNDCSVILPEGIEGAMVQELMAKIEELQRQNSDLKDAHSAAEGRITSLLQQNTEQAARLRSLEQNSNCKPQDEDNSALEQQGDKNGVKGYFLKNLLKIDSASNNAEKARQISKSLALGVAPKH